MQDLGKIHQLIIPFMGRDIIFNIDAMVMTWIVISVLLVFGYFATRKAGLLPEPVQVFGELIVTMIYDLTEDALEERSKTYAPLICALFMFLVTCNWIGLFPHMHEPTKDLNTPLSLGVMGFFIGILPSDLFDGAAECDRRTCQGRFHLLSSVWQHHGRLDHYPGSIVSDL